MNGETCWEDVYEDVKYEPSPDVDRHRKKFEHIVDHFNRRWKEVWLDGTNQASCAGRSPSLSGQVQEYILFVLRTVTSPYSSYNVGCTAARMMKDLIRSTPTPPLHKNG